MHVVMSHIQLKQENTCDGRITYSIMCKISYWQGFHVMEPHHNFKRICITRHNVHRIFRSQLLAAMYPAHRRI